jgi:hypothetical protein
VLENWDKKFGASIIPYLVDTTLQPLVAAMYNLNAKHYAYTSQLIGRNATNVPTSQLTIVTPAQTIQALQNYTFSNCSSINGLVLPQILSSVPQNAVA